MINSPLLCQNPAVTSVQLLGNEVTTQPGEGSQRNVDCTVIGRAIPILVCYDWLHRRKSSSVRITIIQPSFTDDNRSYDNIESEVMWPITGSESNTWLAHSPVFEQPTNN